jgi:hypothetical protein
MAETRNGDRGRHAESRVGLFVDWDDLSQVLAEEAGPDQPIDPAEVAARALRLADAQGRVVLARAYGDWSAGRDAALAFRRQRIEPVLVLGDGSLDEPSDLVLSLDALETVLLGPDLDVYVLVGGERPFRELERRLRRADREVAVAGIDSGELVVVHAAERAASGERRPRRPRPVDFATFDWGPFIRLLAELEGNMPFVGFGWLLKKKLNADNCGCQTMQERQEMMDRAVDDGLLTLYKVDNIEAGADPVTACRLNRDHARVRAVLA